MRVDKAATQRNRQNENVGDEGIESGSDVRLCNGRHSRSTSTERSDNADGMTDGMTNEEQDCDHRDEAAH